MNLLALLFLFASSSVYHEQRFTGPASKPNEIVIPDILCRVERIAHTQFRHGSPISYVSLKNTAPKDRTFTVSCAVLNGATVTRPEVNIPANGTVTLEFPSCWTDDSDTWNSPLTITETTPDHIKAKPFKPQVQPSGFTSYSDDFKILIDEKLSREAFEKALEAAHTPPAVTNRHTHAKANPIKVDLLALRRSAENWPMDWHVYSTFDAVVFAPETHAALPDDIHRALDDYARFGGTVETLSEADFADRVKMQAVTERIRQTRNALSRGHFKAHYISGRSGTHFEARLKDVPLAVERAVPIGLLIVLLGFFALVLVPATIFSCARRNRRLSILVILPGASAALAVVIGLIALFAYGLTPTQRLQSVTFLDQSTHHALTRGQFAVFSPRDVTEQLAFPSDVALEATDKTGEKSLILTDRLYPRGCWIKPLTATCIDFDRTSRQSEKLNVKRVDDRTVSIANLLGVPVEEGWLHWNGNFYLLGRIAPGETVTRTATERLPSVKAIVRDFPADFGNMLNYGTSWPHLLKLLDSTEHLSLPAQTYVVRLTGSPFFPPPFGTHEAKGTVESIVIGTLPEDAK